MRTLLALHLALTSYMVGIIWFVQIVQYPLFGEIGESAFARCHTFHISRITWVVGPVMAGEALSGILLLWFQPRNPLYQIGLLLLVVIWLSTVLVQIPRHDSLGRRFDSDTIRDLISGNWIRTLAWSVRAILILTAIA